MSIYVNTEVNNKNNSNTSQLEFPIPSCIKPIEQTLLIPLGVNK